MTRRHTEDTGSVGCAESERQWISELGGLCLLASLLLALQHHEVVHRVFHAGAGLGCQQLCRGVIHRCGSGVQLVGAPGQRASLAQQRGDHFCRGGTGHVGVGHGVESAVSTARWPEPHRVWAPLIL